jgi:hypothetical protein
MAFSAITVSIGSVPVPIGTITVSVHTIGSVSVTVGAIGPVAVSIRVVGIIDPMGFSSHIMGAIAGHRISIEVTVALRHFRWLRKYE